MNLLTAAICGLLALLLALVATSRVGAWLIERRYPPVGSFAEVAGTKVHHVHVPAGSAGGLPPIVFIHGASGNLLDQMIPVRPLLEGRAEMLFLDRPGHGWSQRGAGNSDPVAQANTIVALMERYGIEKAVIVGHSFGGAVAAALAVEHPEKTAGLVFLSAATHPWPGGETSWYYKLSALPVLGRVFVETLAWPGGTLRIGAASTCVFAPNRMPERYLADAAIPLVLRASAFRWNAVDVAGLYDHVAAYSKRYGEIAVPTVVISGNRDTVVYEEIHSVGLARDITGAEMIWVDNLGHKPDWVAPDLVVAAIEKVSGKPVDLQEAAKKVEARIAGDAHGPAAACPDEKSELSPAG